MAEWLEQTPDLVAEVAGVLAHEDGDDIRQGDIDLIMALPRTRTRRAAARLAGVSEPTVYRRLQDPAFRQRYRKAHDLLLQERVMELRHDPLDQAIRQLGAARHGGGPGSTPPPGKTTLNRKDFP
jgi:hypothetical protein